MRLDVGPTRTLLDALGSPDQGFPIVLVGGTNGKGSVSATLAAIATVSGQRCGLFTSPHLEEPRERIRIDGRALDADGLEQHVAAVVQVGRDLGDEPTYFEATTCAALLAFGAARVDLAILEVGLGGRLDATNATAPILSVICAIALDHQQQLGATVAEIAGEKAGIMRPGKTTLVAPGSESVMAALRAAEGRSNARLEVAQLPFGLVADELTIVGKRDTYRTRPGLAGPHQATNLMLATRAAELLADGGYLGTDPAIAAGLAAVRWPGRFERVLLPGLEVIFDGAHNPAGVQVLIEALGEAPYDLVFGALADKDVGSMLPPLAARATRVILTRPAGTPRALEPSALARLVSRPVELADTPSGAIEAALRSGCGKLVVAGSLYLVGEARTALRQLRGQPPAAAAMSTVAGSPGYP